MADKSEDDSASLKNLKNSSNAPFRWRILKSIVLFAVGVKAARECIGLELMKA